MAETPVAQEKKGEPGPSHLLKDIKNDEKNDDKKKKGEHSASCLGFPRFCRALV